MRVSNRTPTYESMNEKKRTRFEISRKKFGVFSMFLKSRTPHNSLCFFSSVWSWKQNQKQLITCKFISFLHSHTPIVMKNSLWLKVNVHFFYSFIQDHREKKKPAEKYKSTEKTETKKKFIQVANNMLFWRLYNEQ